MSRRGFLASLALGAAGLLAACGTTDSDIGKGQGNVTPSPVVASPTAAGSPTSPASPTSIPGLAHPLGADELVLRFDIRGGFVQPTYQVTQLPMFSLFGDGRVVTQGPQIMIYPGPALPNLLVTKLTEDGVQTVLRTAQAAGLTDGDHAWQSAAVADAPTTTITANVGGRTSVTSVYALGIDSPQPDTTPEERDARASILAFENQLGALRSWLPPAAIQGDDQPFEIKRLQFVIQPADDPVPAKGTPTATPADIGAQPSQAPWPLSTPLAQWGAPYNLLNSRCGVVEGADLAPMLAALSKANQLTRWESAGKLYAAYVRPLLPDENGCPAG